jgi:hypothetical protein
MARYQCWFRYVLCLIAMAQSGCGGDNAPQGPQTPEPGATVAVPAGTHLVTMGSLLSHRDDGATLTRDIDLQVDLPTATLGESLVVYPTHGSGTAGQNPYTGVYYVFGGAACTIPPSPFLIKQAVVRSGAVRVALRNLMTDTLNATVFVPPITCTHPSGRRIARATAIAPNRTDTVELVLDTATLTPPPSDTHLYLAGVTTQVEVDHKGVRLFAEEMLAIECDSDSLYFNSVYGDLQILHIPFDALTVPVTFAPGFDGSVNTATMQVQIANGIPADCVLDLDVIGTRQETGETATLTIPADLQGLPPGNADDPVVTTIRLDESNSDVCEFLNLIPSSIEIRGHLTVSSKEGVDVTVSRSDGMAVSVSIRSALEASFPTVSAASTSTRLIIDARTRAGIARSTGGRVALSAVNGLPVGVGVRVLLGTDREKLEESPDLVVPRQGAVEVDAAQIDAASGLVSEAATHQATLVLTAEEAKVLASSPLYAAVQVTTVGTGSSKIRIENGDFVQVSVQATLQVP